MFALCLISSDTMDTCPCWAACMSGVQPQLFATSMFAPSSRRSSAKLMWPFAAATCRPDMPSTSWPLMGIPTSTGKNGHVHAVTLQITPIMITGNRVGDGLEFLHFIRSSVRLNIGNKIYFLNGSDKLSRVVFKNKVNSSLVLKYFRSLQFTQLVRGLLLEGQQTLESRRRSPFNRRSRAAFMLFVTHAVRNFSISSIGWLLSLICILLYHRRLRSYMYP